MDYLLRSLYLTPRRDLFKDVHLDHDCAPDGTLYLVIVRVLILAQILDNITLRIAVFLHIVILYYQVAACLCWQLSEHIFLLTAEETVFAQVIIKFLDVA